MVEIIIDKSKQLAIDFAIWVDYMDIYRYDTNLWTDDMTDRLLTDSQLFNYFLEDKYKNNENIQDI